MVNSASGPGSVLANALWHSADTTNEVRVLWHDPDMKEWLHETAYRWYLQWRPSLGLIRHVYDIPRMHCFKFYAKNVNEKVTILNITAV